MKQKILIIPLLCLALACTKEEFVRDAGSMPADAGTTPSGALYTAGSFDPELSDFCISKDTEVSIVYRLDYPAQTDVTVTLSIGDKDVVEAYNNAHNLKDYLHSHTGYRHRYRLLPETNYIIDGISGPEQPIVLTVPKGQCESAPLKITLVYSDALFVKNDEWSNDNTPRMSSPWMLPLVVNEVVGDVAFHIGQVLGVGVRPGNDVFDRIGPTKIDEYVDKDLPKPMTYILGCDCRLYDPSYAIYHVFYKWYYVQYTDNQGNVKWKVDFSKPVPYSIFYDIEILRPAFLILDKNSDAPVLKPSEDLMYVLTHQERYVEPQRKVGMKICFGIETENKSPLGLCNLTAEGRTALVWQIKDFVERYGLDGVSLNDAGAKYDASDAAPVDKSSYTLFLKELKETLGDKLVMVSYDESENAALYESHDGLSAGDYIDYAWWGMSNTLCTPYSDEGDVKPRPIAGLPITKFSPISADAVDTEDFNTWWFGEDSKYRWHELEDMYAGDKCNVLVNLEIRAQVQNFYEGNRMKITNNFARIVLPSREQEGWRAFGEMVQAAYTDAPWMSGTYGAGLKDW